LFFSLVVAAFIFGTVLPGLHALVARSTVVGHLLLALPMLQVVLPLSLVLRAILFHVDAIAVCLVIEPLALVDVAIDVPELSLTVSFVEAPMTLILGTILPDLHALTVLHVSKPLAGVGSAVLDLHLTALLKLRFINVLHTRLCIGIRLYLARKKRWRKVWLVERS